ncbi:MAG: hypothetical protein A3K22_02125 [Deltaproteobacteria bacterium RBG_16_42_7]|nr:MAG: hypothetical protein A3K22_02125 [Deltaproteobacteria bacterium RBG_16_42_7]
MADCLNCGKMDIGVNTLGIPATFCSRTCRKIWEVENKNSFTTYVGDSPDIFDARKKKNKIIEGAIEQACLGSRGAKRWLRQRYKIKAVYDIDKSQEVRL